MLDYIFLVLGFIILIKGADLLVDGASSIAKKMGISALVIGLTIVAFGTSAPELIVNIFASLNGNTDIAIGNILGSNIANILLILGVCSIIYPIAVKRGTVWKEIPFSLLAVMVVAFLANDYLVDGRNFSELSRADGLALLCFFIIFLYYTFGISKAEPSSNQEIEIKQEKTYISFFKILIGLIGLTLGGKWIVDSAVNIASSWGVSQAIIGLTVVAVGTSLPELAASAVAAFKKNSDIAIGNVVGSNIFNIFWILGVSAVINPLPFSLILVRDMAMTIIATTILFAVMFIGQKRIIERWQGGIFVFIYFAYVVLLVFQEVYKF